MEFIEKVKEVRKNIKECSIYYDGSNEFLYKTDILFVTGERESGVIEPKEHKEIVEYLDCREEIEFVEFNDGKAQITILPLSEPTIRLKSLKLLSAELKDHYTGLEIIDLLKENGVDRRLLVYPETKWIIFYKVFSELVTSNNQKDKDLLFKIIGESLHPVNLGGDVERSKQLQSKYSYILKYDGFVITNSKIEKINKKDNFHNKNEQRKTSIDYIQDVLNFFKTEYNKVKLKGLSYEYCLGEAFSGLNEIEYSEECKKNLKAIEQLDEAGFIVEHRIYNNSLDNGIWVMVICKIDEDVITEKSPKATNKSVEDFVQKIEIVSGKMEIEGLKGGLENIAKNKIKNDKPKFPYKLPAGTEWKNIIFKFEDDENVYIQAKQHKHYTNYKDMGFIGKGKNPKPSEAWNFLKVLSKQNGELSITDAEAKDKYKHQKQKLSEMLKSYFSIELDPFHPYEGSKSYRIKMTLFSPPTDSLNNPKQKVTKKDNDLGLKDYYNEQAREV